MLLLFASAEGFNLILLFFVVWVPVPVIWEGKRSVDNCVELLLSLPPFRGFWGLNSGLQPCVAPASPATHLASGSFVVFCFRLGVCR